MPNFLLRRPQSAALTIAPRLRVRLARGFFARARGLLGTRSLAPDAGLLIPRCSAVHTFGMRYPIDLLFLDHDATVVAIHPAVPPWRIRRLPGAAAVLEVAAGTAAAIRPGQRLAEAFALCRHDCADD